MLDLLFSNVNLPLTILSGILVIYWLLTMFTGIDWDVDFDVDIDVDADVDLDTHLDGAEVSFDDVANVEVDKDQIVKDRRKPLKWWQIVLIHFNFVGLPFMFTLTAWILFWWIATLLATSITVSYNSSFGFVWFFALILPSLYFTKLFTTPFKSFFKDFRKNGIKPIDFVGRVGYLRNNISPKKEGTVEVIVDGKSLIIHALAFSDNEIQRGIDVLIIKKSKIDSVYLVHPYVNEDDIK
ncbi:MAG: hypothetical protein ACPGSD_06795 [Flavobacteriales bacterium]